MIGNTPLVHLNKLTDPSLHLYGKLEYLQPGGSVKDRIAYQIIRDAYEEGKLKKGQWVVEMTSGNTGAGLAFVCQQFGNPFMAVMSSGNSPERAKIIKALGGNVLLADQVDGKHGQVTGKDIAYAAEIAIKFAQKKHGFYVDQFNNPSGIKAHFENTGPEIWHDLPEIEAFVTSIGTGGTFLGIAKFLKSVNPFIKCIAVEPENAAILKTGKVRTGRHIIQGTGYSLVPPQWEADLADEIVTVTDSEVSDMTRRISLKQGLYVGYSSGANVAAALKYVNNHKDISNIVVILCDTGYKYTNG